MLGDEALGRGEVHRQPVAGLERRDVKLGEVTLHVTEVTDGLRDGEQVVLNPQVEEADFVPSSAPAGTVCLTRIDEAFR